MAIRVGRVKTIKENRTDSAVRVMDAEGKIVTPCFTDIHTHSDFTLPLNSKADGKIRQVVTTEVIGNCG
ncbi:MAG: D-aminoacylase, partial [Pseudomonadota bacterium]|nr:D-aminoacylase [Pseudomonadota bacterium]